MSQSDYTQYIARISLTGKDSLKMLDVIHSRGLPLDRITTTDVWATDTIPAWLPPMQVFRDKMDDWIWSKYHIECEHLCARNSDGSKRTYEQMFYHVPVRRSKCSNIYREKDRVGDDPRLPGLVEPLVPITQEKCQSTGSKEQSPDSLPTPDTTIVRNSKLSETFIKGFPLATGITWCQKLKIRVQTPFPNERPTRRQKPNIVEYIGIAADEPDRFGQLNDRKLAPLVEFGIEEPLCGLYCQYAGCLAPTYETSYRDGCWFCHNQGVDQLRLLRRNYPEYWALMLKWDKDSPVTFKADGHTVHDFDRRFQMEEDGVVPIDNTFRWEPINSGWVSIFDLLRNQLQD